MLRALLKGIDERKKTCIAAGASGLADAVARPVDPV